MTKAAQNGSPYRLGVDVGGTFTDLVLMDECTGSTKLVKMSSTPADPSVAFMDVLHRCLQEHGAAADDCVHLVHGTTVATNTIIEGKGARTALVATEGFRDMLEIGRQIRPRLYDLFCEKPRPLVPRRLCFEARERLDAAGNVLTPLDEAGVRDIAAALREADVESVVICLLHSYANPDHEERIAAILQAELPELAVTVSSQLCSEMREYFRASTATVNALLVPVVGRYVARLVDGTRDAGVTAELHLMTSSGGIMAGHTARREPVQLVESGPAAGVTAAAFYGKVTGYKDLISFDMGGTTAKLGLVEDGMPRVARHFEVGAEATVSDRSAGYPVRTPVVDLVEIGAGGGSIAWMDEGGALRVGPRSGGADPGPACYGKGQTEPCITDANLVLGRLNPDYFIGGEQTLDVALAAAAVRSVGDPLGMDLYEAAHGILEIANTNMTGAARSVSVQRGCDPRGFTLVAFGGAGPLHAAAIAAELHIPRVLVPHHPGVASALGLLVGDIKHDFVTSKLMATESADLATIDEILAAFEDDGRRLLESEHVAAADMQFLPQLDLRYCGQSHELTLELPSRDDVSPAEWLASLQTLFCTEHERLHGFSDSREPSEIVNIRMTAVGRIRRPHLPALERHDADPSAACKATRPVYFAGDGMTDCPIYDRELLLAGNRIAGPAVVEEYDSTTVIPPGFTAEVDGTANLMLHRDDGP